MYIHLFVRMHFLQEKHVLTVICERTQYRISKKCYYRLLQTYLCTLHTFEVKAYFIIYKTKRMRF